MRYAVLITALLVTACSQESDQARAELDVITAAQAKRSAGRDADNVQLCAAHTKLQQAYLKERNAEQYDRERILVTAYC